MTLSSCTWIRKVISEFYYDRSGCGSKAVTLQDARQKNKTITADDVNEFFKKNVDEKRKMRGQNRFVDLHACWEFQLDLFFSQNDLENHTFRIGSILVYICSKYATVIPIKRKQLLDVLAGLMEGIKKMAGNPKMIHSDKEGSFFSSVITDYLDEEKLNYTPREDILLLERDLLEHTKTCLSKGLKRMKRMKKRQRVMRKNRFVRRSGQVTGQT